MVSIRLMSTTLLVAVVLGSGPASAGAQDQGRRQARSPVVAGVLRDAAGAASEGVIAMFAVEADAQGLSFQPLAEGVTSASGRFSLVLGPTAARRVTAAQRSNGGYANVAIAGITSSGVGVTFAPLPDATTGAATASRVDRVQLRTTRTLRPGDRQRAAAIRGHVSGRRPADHPFQCNYRVAERFDRATVVGEMHVMSGVTETFTYANGNTADSTISVAANPSGNGTDYQLAGTVHIGTSDTLSQGRTRTGAYARILKSDFAYARYHKPGTVWPPECTVADDDYVMAYDWTGGWTEGDDVSGYDGDCLASSSRTKPFAGGDDWSRSSNKLQTWSAGVTVFGIGLKTQSGASTQVTMKYVFNGSPASHYQLCGSNAGPGSALRVYVDNDWY